MGMFEIEARAPYKTGQVVLIDGYYRVEWEFYNGEKRLTRFGSKSKKAMQNHINMVLAEQNKQGVKCYE